jgi:hypothetical protein
VAPLPANWGSLVSPITPLFPPAYDLPTKGILMPHVVRQHRFSDYLLRDVQLEDEPGSGSDERLGLAYRSALRDAGPGRQRSLLTAMEAAPKEGRSRCGLILPVSGDGAVVLPLPLPILGKIPCPRFESAGDPPLRVPDAELLPPFLDKIPGENLPPSPSLMRIEPPFHFGVALEGRCEILDSCLFSTRF